MGTSHHFQRGIKLTCQYPPRRYRSDGWQPSTGLGGSLHVEWVAAFTWNGWQVSPEYAHDLTLGKLKRRIPLDWAEQEALFS